MKNKTVMSLIAAAALLCTPIVATAGTCADWVGQWKFNYNGDNETVNISENPLPYNVFNCVVRGRRMSNLQQVLIGSTAMDLSTWAYYETYAPDANTLYDRIVNSSFTGSFFDNVTAPVVGGPGGVPPAFGSGLRSGRKTGAVTFGTCQDLVGHWQLTYYDINNPPATITDTINISSVCDDAVTPGACTTPIAGAWACLATATRALDNQPVLIGKLAGMDYANMYMYFETTDPNPEFMGDPSAIIYDASFFPSGFGADAPDKQNPVYNLISGIKYTPCIPTGISESICNGVDDDCDGQTDEDYAADSSCFLPGACAAGNHASVCHKGVETPCQTGTPVTEVCNNGVDDNCNGQTDEGCTTWYRDADGDTYGNPAVSTSAETKPSGYVADKTDCDDGNSAVHPGAAEACNGIDDNCNGTTDEGCATWYRDADGDGYGNPAVTSVALTQPAGYVDDATDCDDGNSAINPDATELQNGIDDNCNGVTDEAGPLTDLLGRWEITRVNGTVDVVNFDTICTPGNICYGSNVTDFWGPMGRVMGHRVSDGALIQIGIISMLTTVWDYFEGTSLGDATQCSVIKKTQFFPCHFDPPFGTKGFNFNYYNLARGVKKNIYYQDADGDGYGNAAVTTLACPQPTGYVTNSTDCDDSNSAAHPGATELCDGIDNDCDGQTDEGFNVGGACSAGLGVCSRTGVYVCSGGAAVCNAVPGTPSAEICNGLDDDCDGVVDNGNPGGGAACATGLLGICAAGTTVCSGGALACQQNQQPSAELCNGLDDNCNGTIDEDCSAGQTWYRDADGDGYGNPAVTTVALTQPAGYVANSTDCDDSSGAIHPGAAELCNGIDDNCNGTTDEGCTTWYRDADGDGYGNPAVTTVAMTQPAGYVADATDCNDSNSAISPGATELQNGIDDNCNGATDEVPQDVADNNANLIFGRWEVTRDNGTIDVVNFTGKCGWGETCAGITTAWWFDTIYGTRESDGKVIQIAWMCWTPTAYYYIEGTNFDIKNPILDTNFFPCHFTVKTGSSSVIASGVKKNIYYQDADGDGYGVTAVSTFSCTQPSGYVTASGDCDDGNAAIHPDAAEVANGIDDNCNGATDEAGTCEDLLGRWEITRDNGSIDVVNIDTVCQMYETCYGSYVSDFWPWGRAMGHRESDGALIQFGVFFWMQANWEYFEGPDFAVTTAILKTHFFPCHFDTVGIPGGGAFHTYPIATGVKKNIYYQDADGDGYGYAAATTLACSQPAGYVTDSTDCNDSTSAAHPGAPEICDGIDNDCNGQTDEGNPGSGQACSTGLQGICSAGTTACIGGALVCQQNVQPSPEVCNGLDDDCDGQVDEGLGSTTCGVGACQRTVQNCINSVQQTCTPGTPTAEVCNGIDDDCDGVVDNGNPGGGVACNTGKPGVCSAGTTVCSGGALSCHQNQQPSTEVCNGLDDNCDGQIDEGGVCVTTTTTTVLVCPAPDLHAPSGTGVAPLPTFSWQKVDGVSWYNVAVYSGAANMYAATKWFDASLVCATDNCSAQLAAALYPGQYWWWLNTWSDGPCGFMVQPGGKYKQFTVTGCGGPALTAPTGTVTFGTRPAHTFTSSAEWVNLQIYSAALGAVSSQWVDAADACTMGSCEVTPVRWIMALGQHWWWVNTYSTACGYQFQPGGNLGSYIVQ